MFGGKTFLSGVLGLTRSILLGAEVNILGGSQEQAETMQQYIKNEHENTRGLLMESKRAPKGLLASTTATQVKFSNGGSTRALAASQKSTRGKHGTDLYVDEADECEWPVFTSALGQTYEGGRGIKPLTWITSTWQNPDGTMTKIFDEAEEKGWGTYTWCFRETHEKHGGHVTQAEVDRKRNEMTESDWNNEVELQRPEAGDLIFAQEIIEMLFDKSMGEFTDRIGHDYVFVPPSEGETFYHGTDWAKRRDLTIVHTNISNPTGPDTLAAYCMRQKEPWPQMFEHFNKRIRDYGGTAHYDSTGMAGDMTEDHLTVDAEGVDFANRKRIHAMYSSYVTAIEAGEYVYPIIPRMKKRYELLTRGQLYESTRTSKKNHTPDEFVAGALARQANIQGTFTLLFGRAYE